MTKHTVAQVEDMIATEDDAEVSAMLRAYADLLAKKQDNGTTHWAGCSESGAKHYKCALLEISRLRDTVTDLRNKLEKKAWFSAYEKKPWVDLTKEELQTIFNYEPNDVKHIAFLVESLCKEKNGG